MKLLALDTATDLCSVALWLDGRVETREQLAPRAHGQLLLPMVDALLAEASLGLRQLDAIAFGRGPGAFTGLRLAVAVAQGLGFASERPLIPVSDLRALAAQGLARGTTRALICQDARMGEVYWACFEREGEQLRVCGEEHVGHPASVSLPPGWSTGVCGAGSGFAAYPQLQARLGSSLAALLPELYPRAREIAALAAQDGLGTAVSAEQALPVYLRDKVASVAGPTRN